MERTSTRARWQVHQPNPTINHDINHDRSIMTDVLAELGLPAPRSQGLLDGDGFLAHQALHLGRDVVGDANGVPENKKVTFMGYEWDGNYDMNGEWMGYELWFEWGMIGIWMGYELWYESWYEWGMNGIWMGYESWYEWDVNYDMNHDMNGERMGYELWFEWGMNGIWMGYELWFDWDMNGIWIMIWMGNEWGMNGIWIMIWMGNDWDMNGIWIMIWMGNDWDMNSVDNASTWSIHWWNQQLDDLYLSRKLRKQLWKNHMHFTTFFSGVVNYPFWKPWWMPMAWGDHYIYIHHLVACG